MNRNIALCLILSIITCGIYALYWLVVVNDEINDISNEKGTSGIAVLLLTVITCGLYGLYWLYVMGEKADRIRNTGTGSGILYLILGFLTGNIIPLCLLQDTINKARQ